MAKTKKTQQDETRIFAGDERVCKWRFDWLRAVGYTQENALKLAEDTSIDLHFAVNLRKNCSNEELCMRIHYGS